MVPVEGDGREGEAARVIASSADHADHRMETVPVLSYPSPFQSWPHLSLLGGIDSVYGEIRLGFGRRLFVHDSETDAKRAAFCGQWPCSKRE